MSASESKKILSGCAIQLSLSSTIRIIKRPLINNYIDMAQDECVLDSKLSGIYKEKNISLGYVLKPDETILCSSVEVLQCRMIFMVLFLPSFHIHSWDSQ